MIEVKHVNKTFKIFDRRPGIVGAAKDLFSRKYKSFEAVQDISFSIKKGEMVGYIGANGAGKSTTIKMLTGILHPSEGSITVAGFNPNQNRQAFLPNIGVVFGQRSQLWWDLAVQESYRLLQRIYNVSEADYQHRMKRFDEIMGLGEFLATPVRKLSLGQKMRCELAAALLHNPPVVFLDEPTIGLDVVAKVAIRKFLKEINNELGITVILTTHDLQDIEELCHRVMIIDKGALLFDGGLMQLKQHLGDDARLTFKLGAKSEDVSIKLLEETFATQPIQWNCAKGGIVATFSTENIRRAEVIRLLLNEFDIHDISMHDVSIEDVVKDIYEKGIK